MKKQSSHHQPYISVVLSDLCLDNITARYKKPEMDSKDILKSEKDFNSMSTIKLNNLKNQSTNSRSPIIRTFQPNVFPNILKKTKENIKKLREYERSLLNDEIVEQPQQKFSFPQLRPKPEKKVYQSQPQIKPIQTDLSSLAYESLNTSMMSSAKFVKLQQTSSPSQYLWTQNNTINRINKVYELQKEIHHLQRFKTQWKSDMIQQYLQLKIVQQGMNTKKGLKSVYILIYLPKQQIVLKSSQTEAKSLPTEMELSTFQYFIPVYDKIQNQTELQSDYKEWYNYFMELLHFPKHNFDQCCFFLDGRRIQTLAHIPQYERFIFINTQGVFNFWDNLSNELKINGLFQSNKYPKLAARLFDLKSNEDISKFFTKRENFLIYFGKPEQVRTQRTLNYQLEEPVEQVETKIHMFDQSIVQMTEKEQGSYLNMLQQFIHQNKSKYSHKLKNKQENLQQRLTNIKDNRRKSIEIRHKKKKTIKLEEEQFMERKLLYSETPSIDEIRDEALDNVHPFQSIIFKKKEKEIKIVDDPFQSLNPKDNKKFADITKLINVEKIVLEKKIIRADVLHYLTLFKALMDTDEKQQIKELEYPPLFISLRQLKAALPFIALHKNKVNTKKLAEIYARRYNYVDFMDFLDIFTTEFTVSDKELEAEL